ncbi:uncharacterized protein C11orf86 homolog isoform X2 [Perognathus longimembris pacificus]|uniref:uncharacterized protein C11orf86 homolog isoform X2 n=1 Tax=Perognathus longimembris pacificus TaxID=214514 RepID=UPI00201981E8|nr:uncharacterized protein C11orf86 homolog isoform X2 [Perognathus longimembris pacificus]
MGTGLRSQSLRGPRPSYGKLQEPRGTPRRALSLRLGQEKAKSQGLDGGTEGLDTPVSERLSGTLEDTEQLIQAQRGGSRRWLRQYRQVKRRWENFVASFPSVTLSRPATQETPCEHPQLEMQDAPLGMPAS